MSPAADVQNTWEQYTLSNLDEWLVIPVDVVPPGVFAESTGLGSDLCPDAIVLVPKGITESVLLHASRMASRTLAFALLKALAPFLGDDLSSRPRSELQYLQLLIKFVEPTLSDAEVELRIATFRHLKPSTWATTLNERTAQAAKDVLDNDDFEAVADVVSAQKPCARSAGSMGGIAKPKAAGRRPRLKQCDFDGLLTSEEAAQWLPLVSGCRTYKDTYLHMRWKVCYPNPSPPFNHTCAWN